MSLTSVSAVPVHAESGAGGGTDSGAGDPTYVLDTSTDLAAFAAGTFSDGQSEKKGTDEYFTLFYNSKTKADTSSKTFEDGYKGSLRINFGGKLDAATPKNAISFKTEYPATVKVWWACGDVGRQITVHDTSDTAVYTSAEELVKNDPYLCQFKLEKAGTYFLGGDTGNNYFFKVEVTEHKPKEYILDATADLTAFAAGAFTDGQSEKKGTEEYFTLFYSAKTKVDGSNKSFEDGYSGTQRINFGGKLDASTPKNAVSFTTSGSSEVKVWWVEGGDDNRQITVVNGKGETVYTSDVTLAKNIACVSSFELSEAGTYFLGGKENNNYFFKVSVTEGAPEDVDRAEWSEVAAPVITGVTQKGSDIAVTVTAEVGVNGGDQVVVTMTDKDGKTTDMRSLAEKNEHTLNFTPADSGTYTFKAALSREGEATELVSEEAAVDYLLPLGVTNISSATNKGKGSVELIWSAVKEAESYNVYVNGEKAG